jgi:nucleotide-binding universal stress UspA family protein
MIAFLIAVIALLALVVLALGGQHLSQLSRRPTALSATGARRILFPFVADALSQRALDAALRLARAEDAVLVPVFLARVPLQLPLDTPLPRQCGLATSLQEVIEQRASLSGIAVDARIERGRTHRHALRQAIGRERFDRVVIAAATQRSAGFNADDVAWLLDNAPGEIVVLRPDQDEQLGPPAPMRHRRREKRSPARASTRSFPRMHPAKSLR